MVSFRAYRLVAYNLCATLKRLETGIDENDQTHGQIAVRSRNGDLRSLMLLQRCVGVTAAATTQARGALILCASDPRQQYERANDS